MKTIKLNKQWNITLPEHRADRPEYRMLNGWEGERLNKLYDVIRHKYQSPVIYYIGAEEGEMPALCQMWGAKVVLFEPNERVWPNIKAIWEANKLQPPLYCHVGFASHQDISGVESFSLNSFPDCADGELIGDHGFKELKDPGEIAQIKIDSITNTWASAPDIISLDVEGSEGCVLRGAEETIKRYEPDIFLSLHPEFIHEQYNEWGYELRQWIKGLGYRETLLDYQHEVHLYYEAL